MTNQFAISNQVKIRQAEIKDVERIAILSEQLGYSVTIGEIKQRLSKIIKNDSYIIYVATIANEHVIGWAQAHIYEIILMPNQALLHGLVVDENYRNNGIGKLLMQRIEEWAYKVGCEGVQIRSSIRRKEAHLFYEKIGYTNIKDQKAFHKALTRKVSICPAYRL
jgi:GNAT superfamily N-acetyltransferase